MNNDADHLYVRLANTIGFAPFNPAALNVKYAHLLELEKRERAKIWRMVAVPSTDKIIMLWRLLA